MGLVRFHLRTNTRIHEDTSGKARMKQSSGVVFSWMAVMGRFRGKHWRHGRHWGKEQFFGTFERVGRVPAPRVGRLETAVCFDLPTMLGRIRSCWCHEAPLLTRLVSDPSTKFSPQGSQLSSVGQSCRWQFIRSTSSSPSRRRHLCNVLKFLWVSFPQWRPPPTHARDISDHGIHCDVFALSTASAPVDRDIPLIYPRVTAVVSCCFFKICLVSYFNSCIVLSPSPAKGTKYLTISRHPTFGPWYSSISRHVYLSYHDPSQCV